MKRLCLLLLLLLGWGVPGRAEVAAREVRIMIGPGGSVVRELREITFRETEQEVLLEGIPASADLDTLQVGGSRQGVSLLGWQRVGMTTSVPPSRAAWSWVPGRTRRADLRSEEAGPVRCRLTAATARTRWVEVMYQVSNLSWRAEYEIVIRGDIANHLEPLSLDLAGRAVISNGTGRAYADARLLLVGHSGMLRPAVFAPGQLILDDWSPLADRWRAPPPDETLPHAYPMPVPVNMPAWGEVSTAFAATRRQAADRVYSLAATELTEGEGEAWQPLTRYLVLPNDLLHGLGMDLPAGRALVYLGSTRGGPYQQAWLDPTARDGQVRVSLGPTRGVTMNRQTEPRQPGTAGAQEQTVTLKLANVLPTAVKVELVERPPVPLAWSLVRSSRSCERRAEGLEYRMEMAARSEIDITYTVRLTEPAP